MHTNPITNNNIEIMPDSAIIEKNTFLSQIYKKAMIKVVILIKQNSIKAIQLQKVQSIYKFLL